MSHWKTISSCLLLLLFFACQQDKGNYIPDVSDIPVEVNVRQFEQELFAIDTNQIEAGLKRVEAVDPDFAEIYFRYVLRSKDSIVAPEGHLNYMTGFLTHPGARELYQTCQNTYSDFAPYQAEFEKAFQFFKYYFPDQPIPTVTTYLSEFSIACFVYENNALATGLDFFLGNEFPYQEYNPMNPNFSNYLVRTFNKDHLVSKTLKPLVNDLLGEVKGIRMLDHMIHNGKALYILDRLLPYASDTIIMEVTKPQLEWLEGNELEMWAYFLQEELMYDNDWNKYRKFVEYSPNSPGMPAEAPGRTANWIGWMIVEKYMERFPETTMTELINLSDPQQVLDKSRYKPKR